MPLIPFRYLENWLSSLYRGRAKTETLCRKSWKYTVMWSQITHRRGLIHIDNAHAFCFHLIFDKQQGMK